jgi:hypothetical protein
MKRFQQDRRIVMVDSIAEIPRFGTIENMHGILCPYAPFTAEQEQEIATFMKEGRIQSVFGKINPEFYQKVHGITLPAPLRAAFDELQDVFGKATNRCGETKLRANSTHPKEPHRHGAALTYTFAGLGTVGFNRSGKPYNAPQRNIFIFDDEILHMASQEFPKDHQKLTIFVG